MPDVSAVPSSSGTPDQASYEPGQHLYWHGDQKRNNVSVYFVGPDVRGHNLVRVKRMLDGRDSIILTTLKDLSTEPRRR